MIAVSITNMFTCIVDISNVYTLQVKAVPRYSIKRSLLVVKFVPDFSFQIIFQYPSKSKQVPKETERTHRKWAYAQ